MKIRQRIAAAALSAVMLLGAVPHAFAADDIETHWGKTYISYLSEHEIYRANSNTGLFEPDRDMTRAEFMRYINRAFNFTEKATINYTDVKSSAWYYETIQIAQHYGYINGTGDGKMSPDGTVTREQAAVILGRLFKVDYGVSNIALEFTDANQIQSWSGDYIRAAVERGFLTGYADGSFQPKRVVSRAETAKLLYSYMGTLLDSPNGVYTYGNLKDDTKNVTISVPCTLSSATIEGDLYITEGCGKNDVKLIDVTVKGNLIISGGTVETRNVNAPHMIVSAD